MRTIYFHGPLKAKQSTPIKIEADSVAQAINAVSRMTKIFSTNPLQGRMTIRIVGFETIDDICQPSDEEELHVVPSYAGGKSAWVTILIGVVFVAAAIATGGATLSLGSLGSIGGFALGTLSISTTTLFWMGAGLILGGLTQMLFPQPVASPGEVSDVRYLGAPVNTVALGTRIPIIFGETMAWGHFLSYNIDALAE